jgi:hypothetical protein
MQHQQAPTSAPDDLLRLTVPVGLKRVGREMRMLVENADEQTPADPSLLRIMARAHHIQARDRLSVGRSAKPHPIQDFDHRLAPIDFDRRENDRPWWSP